MENAEPNISIQPLKEDAKNKLSPPQGLKINDEQECPCSETSSVEKSQMVMQTELDFQSSDVSFLGKSQMESNGESCQTSQVSPVSKCEMDVDGKPESESPNVSFNYVTGAGFPVKNQENAHVVPKVGVEFESEDHAYKCYSRYAILQGFSIRKDFVNRSRINGQVVSRRYTCYRQGYRPTKHNANVRKPRQETRSGCLAHMTIACQPNGKFRVTHFETKHNHEFVTPCTAHMLPSQKRLTFAQAVEADLANSSSMDGVPKLGMGFESENHAYDFYNSYAGRIGFSVRKDYVNRSKIDGGVASRRFTCFREGFRQKDKRDLNVKRPRKETRIGCLAQLVISRQPDGKYRVTHFEEKHNHELVAASRVRMLRSQKRVALAQVVESNAQDGSKDQSTLFSEFSCQSVRDCVDHGYNTIDYSSRLSSKRTREMKEGEAGRLQQYFQTKQAKNPSFFYAMQLDAEDQIANIFWADAKMVVDYSDFGDVVCFDTTCRLNNDCRPFSPFIGVNHHQQMVVFGAALLYDETVDSFKWLFRTFLEAMSGKTPKTFVSDEDPILTEAIDSVFPESDHRICVWHVYQKILKQLSPGFAGSSSFVNDVSSCLFYHEEEEDFINAWKVLLDVYGLWENEWLTELFENREKWAMAYRRHIFCAGIKGSRLYEGFDSNLKKYLKFDTDVLSFLKYFGKLVSNWHYKELEANYNMSQNMPRLIGDIILLKHARDLYTPEIFELFQQEYETCLNMVIDQGTETGPVIEYKVSIFRQLREYRVIFNFSDMKVACNCMKFEFMGVLCSHALKVLDYKNIKMLPIQFILKRWTRDARI